MIFDTSSEVGAVIKEVITKWLAGTLIEPINLSNQINIIS